MNEKPNAVENMPPPVSDKKQAASLDRAAVATFAGESLPGGEMPSNVPQPGEDFDRFLSQPVGHLTIEKGNLVAKDGEGLWRLALLMWGKGLNREDETSSPHDVFRILAHGQSVGFHPAQSLNWIMIVKGRTTIWGDACLALANKSGLMETFEETMEGELDSDRNGDLSWTCRIKLKTGGVIERTFSAEDARRAGLWGKRVYEKYPKRMIQMRTRNWALKDAIPEALLGFAIYEELADEESFNPSRARGAPTEGRMHLRPNPAQKSTRAIEQETKWKCSECCSTEKGFHNSGCSQIVLPDDWEGEKKKSPEGHPEPNDPGSSDGPYMNETDLEYKKRRSETKDQGPDDPDEAPMSDHDPDHGDNDSMTGPDEKGDEPEIPGVEPDDDDGQFGIDLNKTEPEEDAPPEPTDQVGRLKILVELVKEHLIYRWPREKITLKDAEKLTRQYLKQRGAKPNHLENDQTYAFLKKKIPDQNWEAWKVADDKV